MGEFNVNKTTGGLDPTAGMPERYPAEQVMKSDGVTSVEDALDELINSKVIASVTADGVKTYSTLLDEISPYVDFGCTLSIAGNLFTARNNTVYYNLHMTSGGSIQAFIVRLSSSGSMDKAVTFGANGNTIEDMSSNVPNNGTIISLIKFL